MLELRPYQEEAIEAVNSYLCTSQGNPCVVLPTGSGKSFVMASAINRWTAQCPTFRCVVLAHRKELVDQNSQELFNLLPPGSDVGVYSVGMGRRDVGRAITFASIDSVYNKASLFGPLDAIIVDEAHRIPIRGEGKYRRFIRDCRKVNPRLRVIGFTATPFRLGSGPICHKDYILNEVCYEANVGTLIEAGYLCRLRSKVSEHAPDLGDVRKVGGDYSNTQLARAVVRNGLVPRTVKNALGIIAAERRRSCVWFCVDVEHCMAVAEEIRRHGIKCAAVTGTTGAAERDRAVEDFRAGRIRHILNVNVFTEGFNVKQVDAIILLRPTLSRGLFAQMVGRGLRLHPDKSDCLVLDYAHCIETHGPIDAPYAGKVAVEVCGNCREVFARGLRACPRCGWEIPKQVIEEREAAERERRMHEARAAQLSILGSQPQECAVDDVVVTRHSKPGSPDSLCVMYRCGMRTFREWICLDHPGYAGNKAQQWWRERFGGSSTVNDALGDIFLAGKLLAITRSVTVVMDGKYFRIIQHQLRNSNEQDRQT